MRRLTFSEIQFVLCHFVFEMQTYSLILLIYVIRLNGFKWDLFKRESRSNPIKIKQLLFFSKSPMAGFLLFYSEYNIMYTFHLNIGLSPLTLMVLSCWLEANSLTTNQNSTVLFLGFASNHQYPGAADGVLQSIVITRTDTCFLSSTGFLD